MRIRHFPPLMILALLAPLTTAASAAGLQHGDAMQTTGATTRPAPVHIAAASGPATSASATAQAAAAQPAPTMRAQQIGQLNFTPCTLNAPPMPGMPPVSLQALCSTLSVPEDPGRPEGRKIGLKISWVAAAGKASSAEPLVLLAGGPGQSARESWPMLSAMLGKFPSDRPVLLIDQRGTGESNPLHCASPDGRRLIDLEATQIETLIASCPRQLADRADVRFYTTPHAVQDIEAVRKAMNIEQLNLLGISHGTRVAQHYARQYPQHVRLMVLDAPLPNPRSLMEGAPQLYHVLDRIFGLCQRDPQCSLVAPEPAAQLNRALRTLRDNPVTVQAPDPFTGKVVGHRLDDDVLGTTIRMMAYTQQTAQLLPGLVAQVSGGQHDQAALLGSIINHSLSQMIPLGTYYAATCGEDFNERPLPRLKGSDPLGIDALLQGMQKGCAKWPASPLPKDFHEPLTSSVPTLVLSGEWDPVIPPHYGDEIVKGLSKARHVVLKRQHHGVIGSGCMPKVVDAFLQKPDPAALDTGCLDTR